MTSLSKKPAVVAKTARKRGRPVGSKNKPKKIILSRTQVELANKLGVTPVELAKETVKLAKKRKPAAAAKSFKQAELQRLRKVGELVQKNLELMKDNTDLVNHINNLEYQIVGFRAVISYLEKQSGLRNTQ